MQLRSFEALARALADFGVRYLVAGGLAVGAHGYLRYTKDADLVIELSPDNVLAAFKALATIGYAPLVPVTADHIGNAELRQRLIDEKGMQVLQFVSDLHRETPVDVFVEFGFVFDDEHERALVRTLPGVGDVRFVSLPTLIAMKAAADRPQDRIDVANLRALLAEGDDQTS